MPLPDTLPKASTKKKGVKKRAGESDSRHSAGWTTAGETTIFSLWPSVVSLPAESRTADQTHILDNRGDGFEHRDEFNGERATETTDDESFPSYLSNSIISNGTPMESVSLSGSEASLASHYSQIYEPRILQQQGQVDRARIKRREDEENKLEDIPEDEPLRGSPNRKRPESSWKLLFKRHRKHKEKTGSSSTVIQSNEVKGDVGENLIDVMDSELDAGTEKVGINATDNAAGTEYLPTSDTTTAATTGGGWLAMSSWFSNDSVDPTDRKAKQDPFGNIAGVEESIADTIENQYVDHRKESEESLFNGLGTTSEELKQVHQPASEAFIDATKDDSTNERSRSIPSILPMPMSFLKKRKDMQKQQQKQRQRILSILESEDQNSNARSTTPTRRTLEEPSHCDNLSLNPIASHDISEDVSKKIGGRSPKSTSSNTRAIIKLSSKRQPNSNLAAETNSAQDNDDAFQSREYPKDQILEFESLGQTTRSRKNDLKNIVVRAKAERLMHQGTCHIKDENQQLDPEPEQRPESELDWNQKLEKQQNHEYEYLGKKQNAHSIVQTKRILKAMDKIGSQEFPTPQNGAIQHASYLGKKKTPHSILEEKRLLKEMDKIVKNRLKALEEIEHEATDTNSQSTSFCGCVLLPT
ncbi:hypothetical protein IV203_036423 [Nitzschia inconspicua]|uniref:Uncharacterized protein n=2 Tax=Nitzschia inconspicua TaxID=303405 RepID=A0A9K3LGQ9_9STRA|nr:hypothetical protein IV203_036423 [Nitzschia inconspicua]